MSAFNLRPYQQGLTDEIYAAWGQVENVLAVCPTGGGKTVVFSAIAQAHVGAVAAIVHRREIVGQISLALAKMGVKHRVIAPASAVRNIRRRHLKVLGKSFVDQNALAGVASVQTLTSKSAANNPDIQRWVIQVTLAIYDEGHHYVRSGIWSKGVEMFKNAKRLFVTATPERADGQGMGSPAAGGNGYCDVMIEGPTPKWLIEQGFLSRFTYKAPETDLDVADVAVTASGDFNAKALRARVVESHIVGDAVRHYHLYADAKRAIVFATDVETAEEIAEEFRTQGYSAVALSGQTEQGERDRQLEGFERGEVQVLVNVDLFDEGFDVPAVECVVMVRPTQSLAKFLQMVGRSLRVMDGKDEAIIIDSVRNWERHGLPTWPRNWTLASREKKSGSTSDTIPLKSCQGCAQPYEAYHKACPYCGFEKQPAERSAPEHVDGDLMELDLEAMDALFSKIRRADMADADFQRDMVARNVPSVGRGRQLKAHRDAKYRRQVLRELVGWWVGMQPENRPLSEKHRRFYHRFGVDIGTAFTLDAKDTDALIGKIGDRFAEDMSNGL